MGAEILCAMRYQPVALGAVSAQWAHSLIHIKEQAGGSTG